MDLEAKRLEVMKRRQERELEQMLSFELARKSLQVRKPWLHGRFFHCAKGFMQPVAGGHRTSSLPA